MSQPPRRSSYRFCLGATLLAAALFVTVGCGGSGSKTSGNGSTVTGVNITKAELILQGDADCRRTDRIQDRGVAIYTHHHPEKVTSIEDQEEVLLNVAFPPIEEEIDRLAALGAPKGEQARVHAIIGGFKNALVVSKKHPSSLLLGEGAFVRPDQLAGRYGFKDCAKAL